MDVWALEMLWGRRKDSANFELTQMNAPLFTLAHTILWLSIEPHGWEVKSVCT
jgi:hypothetical protein